MTLLQGTVGKTYQVKEIRLEEAVARRLQMLGLLSGTSIEVLNKKRSGGVIFKVRGIRYAIGKHIAQGILLGGGEA